MQPLVNSVTRVQSFSREMNETCIEHVRLYESLLLDVQKELDILKGYVDEKITNNKRRLPVSKFKEELLYRTR